MNSVSDGIAIINKSGKVIWINKAFSVLLNLSDQECYEFDFSPFQTGSSSGRLILLPSSVNHLHHHYIPITEDGHEENYGIIVLTNQLVPSYPNHRRIIDTLSEGIILLKIVSSQHNPNQDFEFIYINPEAERLLNRKATHLTGKKFSDECPEFAQSGLTDLMTSIINSPKIRRQEYFYPYRNYRIRFEAIIYDKEHVILTLLDISDQMNSFSKVRESHKQQPQAEHNEQIENESALINDNRRLNNLNSELQLLNEDLKSEIARCTQELELSNERFRLLTKATNDIAWDWNLLDNQLTFNEIFNTEFGSYKGTNGLEYWKSKLHPEDKDRVISELLKSIHNPEIQSWKAEYRLLSRHGYYELILDRGYIIRDDQRNPLRMVGSMLKMSDVKIIESKLRTSEQMYQVLAESMPQLVYSVNAKGHGDYFNLRWLEYLGSLPKKMTEDMWSDIIFPDDLHIIRQEWAECSQTQRDLNVELRLRNKEGDYRWFLTRATPILDNDNCIIRWIGTSTDIHDQKTQLENLEKSEQQLNHDLTRLNFTNQNLAKLNKELDSFIHIASHDLRNPIKNMEFLLNMMQEELNPYLTNNDNLREIFSLVQKSNKVLKNLVIDLTEIPVNNEEDNEIPELVDVEEILTDVLTSIGDLIMENDPDLHIDLQIKKIHIRPKEIRSILFNLINNAIKYRYDTRRPVVKISFNYSSSKDKLILKVEDNGIGIAKEDLNKVFVPFKRLHKVSPGLGLGMSLVKQTIEKNGGAIEVCSELGKGTIFTITLPASLI